MDNLRTSLIQDVIIPDDPAANLKHFSQVLAGLQTDLVILPEVFTTGFHPLARQHAETPNGRAYDWMREQAQRLQAVVTGSLVVKTGDTYVNRLVWMPPEGAEQYYDKRHLFRMAGEHERYAMGRERKIFLCKGWRVLPQVCYDLRFPVWSRNSGDYDLALYVANWPAARQDHWLTLLKARAIENLVYVAGVNRVGVDVKGQAYDGGSSVFDPKGGQVASAADGPGVVTAKLDASFLQRYRDDFPAHMDADRFTLMPDL